MIAISDSNDERVQEFLTLRNKDTGEYILCDSEKVVNKLFTTNLKIEKIFVTEEYYNENKEKLESKVDRQSLFVADKKLIEQIVGYKLHHGVMAKAKAPLDTPLNKLDDRIIVLNGITSPENVGAILRSSTAFGINSIIVDSKSASPLLRRAIRVSMGNVFFSKLHHCQSLDEQLLELQEKGYQIFGTANEPNSIDLEDMDFPNKCALIIGSEGWGMDASVRNRCSQTIKITINEDVAHLNAAMAATIFSYRLKNSSS